MASGEVAGEPGFIIPWGNSMIMLACTPRLKSALLILASLCLISCSGNSHQNAPGGPCRYHSYAGTVKFTALTTTTNGVEAHFDFTAADSTALNWPSDTDNHLVLPTGLPSQQWLDTQHISIGVQLSATRQDILSGTCTPINYSFPSLPDNPHGI